MSKKIYVSPSSQYANLYATGGTNEKEQCKKIAKYCVDYLKKAGFQVKCTYNDDMYKRVNESNSYGADMHLAIHTNATVKHNVTGGTQILLYNLKDERKKAGQAVLDELKNITPGSSAEKLIAKPGFYEVRKVKAMTVFCECEFHDTKEGSDFIINNTKKLGEAIAKGVCKYYGVSLPDETTENKNNAPQESGTLYTVQVGAFKSKSNAEEYLKKLSKAGFEGFVTVKN